MTTTAFDLEYGCELIDIGPTLYEDTIVYYSDKQQLLIAQRSAHAILSIDTEGFLFLGRQICKINGEFEQQKDGHTFSSFTLEPIKIVVHFVKMQNDLSIQMLDRVMAFELNLNRPILPNFIKWLMKIGNSK